MLNEVWTLAKALDKQGLAVSKKSTVFKPNKNAPGLRVLVNSSGDLATVDLIEKDKVSSLSRYELANGRGFPTFNLSSLRTFSKDDKKALADRAKAASKAEQPAKAFKDLILELLARPSNEDANYYSEIKARLTKTPKELLQVWAGDAVPAEFLSIKKLIISILSKDWEGKEFLSSLESMIKSYCEKLASSGDLNSLQTIYKICFGGKPTILLDYLEAGNSYSVISSEMKAFLNEQLLLREGKTGPTRSDLTDVIDSLSGRTGSLENRFPSPTLPVLGKAILFSNPKDLECQSRYGLTEGGSFTAIKETTQKLQDTLYFITDKSRSGETWQAIPSDAGGADLLIAYVEQAPKLHIGLANLFSDKIKEGVFEEKVKLVVEKVKTFERPGTPATIKFLVISKPDPGRCQVYLNSLITSHDLEKCAARWSSGCMNIPDFPIILPPEAKGGKVIDLKPKTPPPFAALRTLNTCYLRDGTDSAAVRTATLRDIYALFMGEELRIKVLAKRFLPNLICQAKALLLTLGGAIHSKDWTRIKPELRLVSRDILSILGLLLFLNGRKKELYMSETSFNLGRLLQAADILHREYCYVVRNKDESKNLPPVLIGQALFNTAMARPNLALKSLMQRLMPYLTWARNSHAGKNESESKNIGLAKWAVKHIEQASQNISREFLDTRMSDTDQAELFLGYLSNLNKESIIKEETL